MVKGRASAGLKSTLISHRFQQLRYPRNLGSNKVVQSPVEEEPTAGASRETSSALRRIAAIAVVSRKSVSLA